MTPAHHQRILVDCHLHRVLRMRSRRQSKSKFEKEENIDPHFHGVLRMNEGALYPKKFDSEFISFLRMFIRRQSNSELKNQIKMTLAIHDATGVLRTRNGRLIIICVNSLVSCARMRRGRQSNF